jgi:hypothetical protein
MSNAEFIFIVGHVTIKETDVDVGNKYNILM